MAWTLAGRYRLTRSVAHGPIGQVWQGLDEGTDRPVAVKVLHRELTADPRPADRLLRARRALTALWHPGIARLLDVVVAGDVVGLVTDFVPGTDLARRLADGPLAPAQAAMAAAALADALHAAHLDDVVHGDLKPSNVILPPGSRPPALPAPVLTDFSVATLVLPGRTDQPASPYAPPWLVDSGTQTPSSDVYALGVVLAEMLTGTTTTDGARPRVDPRLWEVVDRCVHMDPTAPVSAGQVARRLRQLAPLLPDRPTVAPARSALPRAPAAEPPPGAPAHRPRAPRRNRVKAALGGTVAAAVVAAAAVVTFSVLTRAEPTTPSPSRTTTVAATGLPPSPPAAAEAPTQDGGAEFVGFWFAALTYAVRTGDTTVLAEATNPECQECQRAFDAIGSAYAGDGSMRGGAYVLRGVSTTDLWSPDQPVYDVTVDRSPRTAVDATGEIQATLAPLSFANCVLVLEWVDARWRVREVVTPDCVA